LICSTATALGRAAAYVTDRFGGYFKVTGAVPATCTRRRLRALSNATNATNATNKTNATPSKPTTSKVVIYV
jgi:hypothetical protein